MDIGKKLKELRLQNDLTLGDLASRSELTKGFLSQVERNLTMPSIATLEDILEALGTNFHKSQSRRAMSRSMRRRMEKRRNFMFLCFLMYFLLSRYSPCPGLS